MFIQAAYERSTLLVGSNEADVLPDTVPLSENSDHFLYAEGALGCGADSRLDLREFEAAVIIVHGRVGAPTALELYDLFIDPVAFVEADAALPRRD